MADLAYLELPIDADEGFPQAFRLALANNFYTLLLYVNAPEEVVQSLPDAGVLDLGSPLSRAFMVMRVTREAGAGAQVIFQRKLVRNYDYLAAELAFRFSSLLVAKGNLNGVGTLGSAVNGLVAVRWVS